MKRNSYIFTLTFVGMIAAFGPFVTDFYLPALPALSDYFGTPASMIQLSLTVGMIGLGTGQLVVGPLSDRYGRRLPLLVSLAAFVAATAGCIMTDSIGRFLLYRFVQGLAGAGGVVISRSVATDLYAGRELARFFSVLGSVQGIVPVAAPVIGGLLLAVTDWKGIFAVLLGIGILLLVMTLTFRESLAQRSRSVTASFKGYAPCCATAAACVTWVCRPWPWASCSATYRPRHSYSNSNTGSHPWHTASVSDSTPSASWPAAFWSCAAARANGGWP